MPLTLAAPSRTVEKIIVVDFDETSIGIGTNAFDGLDHRKRVLSSLRQAEDKGA